MSIKRNSIVSWNWVSTILCPLELCLHCLHKLWQNTGIGIQSSTYHNIKKKIGQHLQVSDRFFMQNRSCYFNFDTCHSLPTISKKTQPSDRPTKHKTKNKLKNTRFCRGYIKIKIVILEFYMAIPIHPWPLLTNIWYYSLKFYKPNFIIPRCKKTADGRKIKVLSTVS
jgi:hypothetical protein